MTRITSDPTGKLDVLSLALPPRRATVPRTVVPSQKVTAPLGVPLRRPTTLTLAFKVTGRPRLAVLGLMVTTVTVPTLLELMDSTPCPTVTDVPAKKSASPL